MTNNPATASAGSGHSSRGGCPYEQLHIYYARGRLSGLIKTKDKDFLGHWEEEDTHFLFFHQPADALVDEILADHPLATLVDSYCIPYDQWQGGFSETIRHAGFTIRPAWEPREKASSLKTLELVLDPGVVFGAANHGTTLTCLEMIRRAVASGPVETALDLGCGTGILALACAAGGSRATLAVDLNRLAVETTQTNIRLNRLENKVLAVVGDAVALASQPADLLIANIHWPVMENIIQQPGFSKFPRFILSGLMRSQARAAGDLLAKKGAWVRDMQTADGIWFTFFGENGNRAKNGQRVFL